MRVGWKKTKHKISPVKHVKHTQGNMCLSYTPSTNSIHEKADKKS